jgi:hypothetical protein
MTHPCPPGTIRLCQPNVDGAFCPWRQEGSWSITKPGCHALRSWECPSWPGEVLPATLVVEVLEAVGLLLPLAFARESPPKGSNISGSMVTSPWQPGLCGSEDSRKKQCQ